MLRAIRRAAWGGAIGVLGFVVLTVTGGWLVTDRPLGERQVATGPASLPIGGPFALTDHRGRAVTERDFRGRPMAVMKSPGQQPAKARSTGPAACRRALSSGAVGLDISAAMARRVRRAMAARRGASAESSAMALSQASGLAGRIS